MKKTVTISYTHAPVDEKTTEICITLSLDNNDFIYKDYIDFSVDHPDIQLSAWKSSTEPINHYIPAFKDTKKIFNKTVTFTLTAQSTSYPISDAHLHMSYYRHAHHRISEQIFPLPIGINILQQSVDVAQSPILAQKPNSAGLTTLQPSLKPKSSAQMPLAASLNRFHTQMSALSERAPASLFMLIALILALVGPYVLYQSDRASRSVYRSCLTLLGIILVSGSLIIGCYGYKARYNTLPSANFRLPTS